MKPRQDWPRPSTEPRSPRHAQPLTRPSPPVPAPRDHATRPPQGYGRSSHDANEWADERVRIEDGRRPG